MPALPVKPQYRPTLPDLLAERPPALRRLAIAAVALVGIAALALAILYPRDPWVVHGADPAFSLQYPRELKRVAAPAGTYARAEQRDAAGNLLQAVEVGPLRLPPFSGDVSAALPVFATAYVRQLAASLPGFRLSSEGKTRVDKIPGYWLAYTVLANGRALLVRKVFLVPTLSGSRTGVTLTLTSTPRSNVLTPDQLGVNGELYEPLHTFRFG